MEKNDVDSYRDRLDQDISETFKEIDTNISYIIIGALGFFITMLDKFIDVQHALLTICMFASFGLLLSSFVLFLWGKHLKANQTLKLLEFFDNNFLSSPPDTNREAQLASMWQTGTRKINNNRNIVYILLGAGVTLEVIFFSINIFYKNKNDLTKPIKIEIVGKNNPVNTSPKSNTIKIK